MVHSNSSHSFFFGRPAKLGILILLAELRLHDLYVDGVMGGGRSQYSARLVSKICIKYLHTGIPRFMLLMWGHNQRTAEAKTA